MALYVKHCSRIVYALKCMQIVQLSIHFKSKPYSTVSDEILYIIKLLGKCNFYLYQSNSNVFIQIMQFTQHVHHKNSTAHLMWNDIWPDVLSIHDTGHMGMRQCKHSYQHNALHFGTKCTPPQCHLGTMWIQNSYWCMLVAPAKSTKHIVSSLIHESFIITTTKVNHSHCQYVSSRPIALNKYDS
jgi:hypothetical protein